MDGFKIKVEVLLVKVSGIQGLDREKGKWQKGTKCICRCGNSWM